MTSHILMVEDDEALAAMVSQYLAQSGYELHTSTTGIAAVSIMADTAFDAVILDIMLPDIDGFEVCRRIRAISDVPILMLTARGDELDRIVGLELGADDYLPKPFNPRELLARLRAVTRRHQPKMQTDPESNCVPRLRFGRLSIDLHARQITVDGKRCELTGYQFDLLVALAQRAGRVLSRDELMNALRGHDVGAFDRTIDVHISRLRAAIEDDPKKPLRILTVRGVGYVFAREQDGGL